MAKVVLAKILKEKKITPYRFAKLLGTTPGNVSRIFKPGFNPRLSTLEKWAEVLDVSVKDLIDD